jgi:hypothetical protein
MVVTEGTVEPACAAGLLKRVRAGGCGSSRPKNSLRVRHVMGNVVDTVCSQTVQYSSGFAAE